MRASSSHPLSLDRARSCLAAAETALAGWYTRQTDGPGCYVSDGRDAVAFVDQLLAELHRVRARLVAEIRADDEERAARVDRLIAEFR